MLNFIKKEKIYILFFLFILIVNVTNSGEPQKEIQGKEKSFSTMTFQEAGITEEKVKDFLESEKPSAKFFAYGLVLFFFIFIVSIISNFIFIFRGRKIEFKASHDKKVVSWGVPDIVRVTLIIVFLSYVIGLIESLVFKLFNIELGLNLHMMVNTFFVDIAVAMVILYFVVVKYKENLHSLGLKFSHFFKNVFSGVSSYIFILPLLFSVLILSVWILGILKYSPPPQPVFEMFMEEKNTKILFFLTIFISILGPIIEEMFFRGFMYSALRKRLGIWAGAFLSGSIFSLLHTNVVGFLPIMTLGVLLAYLYEKTGSLVAPIAVHIIHNSIIIGFVFFIKQFIG